MKNVLLVGRCYLAVVDVAGAIPVFAVTLSGENWDFSFYHRRVPAPPG